MLFLDIQYEMVFSNPLDKIKLIRLINQ